MTDRKGFDLGDYVEVKDRIKLFYELYGQGRLVTTDVRLTNEPDGVPRVMVEAAAYRTPDDVHPARGWSWMELPGKTTYTKGSELENTETSAWGRAIAALGILVDRSIASAQEVSNKSGSDPAPVERPSIVRAEGGLIGVASLGRLAAVDGELRETPDGWACGFVLGEGRGKVQVVATGPLAEVLQPLLSEIVGKRVQVFGPITADKMRVKDRDVPFERMALERIVTTEWTLPAPVQTGPGLFDANDDAAVDAAMDKQLAKAG